jgi:hypothetical protein
MKMKAAQLQWMRTICTVAHAAQKPMDFCAKRFF